MLTGPTAEVGVLLVHAEEQLRAAHQAHADAQRALRHAEVAMLKALGAVEFLGRQTGPPLEPQPSNGRPDPVAAET